MSLPFCISQEKKSVERVAVQDPKVWGARPPEELFRAQKSSQACGSHSAFFVVIHPPVLSQTVLDLWSFTLCVYINHRLLTGWRQSSLSIIYTIRFPSWNAHLKHSKHYNGTLLHCSLKKFCELPVGNIVLCSFFPADKNAAEQKIHGMWNPQILSVCISFWEQKILFSLHIWLYMNFAF